MTTIAPERSIPAHLFPAKEYLKSIQISDTLYTLKTDGITFDGVTWNDIVKTEESKLFLKKYLRCKKNLKFCITYQIFPWISGTLHCLVKKFHDCK